LSGIASGSLAYDGTGRRRGKTISGTTTNFLYDGLNLVQELTTSGTPTANLLTGLGFDETFARADGGGAGSLLTDALGSTIELADASGTLQTHYTYDPFGETAISGASSANGQQFTGRESDSTGEYFFRARYYDTSRGRFISEDPLGFEGGVDLYAYALDSPTNLTDPTGLDPEPFFECWAKCIERRRYAFPFPLLMPIPKGLVPPFRVPKSSQPYTTPLSVLQHLLGDLAPELGIGLRDLGRILSPIGTVGTLGEGFYDWYVIIDCAKKCKDRKCQ
jgi:RHS repeat-associated protein